MRYGKRKHNLKYVKKDINNICFIDKYYGNIIIGNNLKNKINILQINIKKFLRKINNEINSPLAKLIKLIYQKKYSNQQMKIQIIKII